MNSKQENYSAESDDISLQRWGVLADVSDPDRLDECWTSIAMNLLKYSKRQSNRDAYKRLRRLSTFDRKRIWEQLHDEVSGQSSPNCTCIVMILKIARIHSSASAHCIRATRIVVSVITESMRAIAMVEREVEGKSDSLSHYLYVCQSNGIPTLMHIFIFQSQPCPPQSRRHQTRKKERRERRMEVVAITRGKVKGTVRDKGWSNDCCLLLQKLGGI